MQIVYKLNTASEVAILTHLNHCNNQFVPALSTRVSLETYAKKIADNAILFEAWSDQKLIGMAAMYLNEKRHGYITNVSVYYEYGGKGIAKQIFVNLMEYINENNISEIKLEVSVINLAAINLYKNFGFKDIEKKNNQIIMLKKINMKTERNYNQEFRDTDDHKYSYNFDFDVMHHYMLRSFIPFFKEGNFLELGSYKGDFTKKFLPYFQDITCVEASDEAVKIAKETIGDRVKYVNGLFEEVSLPTKYENIVLTHVLEHITDPVAVLKKINDEWLSDTGRFFLVCPNANAPSRQIAVKMGLITHNSAVTLAEKEHGHQITYTLDTLERDARLAGLKVVHRSGIFFKALANFQWDQLLNTDIISKEYLEGCYQLGQQYPDLCSSIFLMCEKGN